MTLDPATTAHELAALQEQAMRRLHDELPLDASFTVSYEQSAHASLEWSLKSARRRADFAFGLDVDWRVAILCPAWPADGFLAVACRGSLEAAVTDALRDYWAWDAQGCPPRAAAQAGEAISAADRKPPKLAAPSTAERAADGERDAGRGRAAS